MARRCAARKRLTGLGRHLWRRCRIMRKNKSRFFSRDGAREEAAFCLLYSWNSPASHLARRMRATEASSLSVLITPDSTAFTKPSSASA